MVGERLGYVLPVRGLRYVVKEARLGKHAVVMLLFCVGEVGVWVYGALLVVRVELLWVMWFGLLKGSRPPTYHNAVLLIYNVTSSLRGPSRRPHLPYNYASFSCLPF